MPFRPAPSRRASGVTQSEIAISRVLADMGSADQLAHADPALRVACPTCEALSHQRCLERNPKQYVSPHAERAALATGLLVRLGPSLVITQGDLVGLGDVVGLNGSQSVPQALARLPQELEGVGGGAQGGGALRISPVFFDEVGL